MHEGFDTWSSMTLYIFFCPPNKRFIWRGQHKALCSLPCFHFLCWGSSLGIASTYHITNSSFCIFTILWVYHMFLQVPWLVDGVLSFLIINLFYSHFYPIQNGQGCYLFNSVGFFEYRTLHPVKCWCQIVFPYSVYLQSNSGRLGHLANSLNSDD